MVKSFKLSLPNQNIFYKLDNTQPSGSFKIRGIGHMINTKFLSGEATQIVASSGGNAGAAAAYSSHLLNIPATIYVPKSTNEIFIKKLQTYSANVLVHGSAWDETDVEARKACAELEGAMYIPPFDHELIWVGNSTLIDELAEQMGEGVVPDCIIASVGGGGLMCGIIEGVVRKGWMDRGVKLVAVETEGADCFSQAIRNDGLVTLTEISSIAKTLGAKTCAKKLFDYYKQYASNIESIVLSDKESVQGCLWFLDEQKMLVEPGCGVSIAVAGDLEKHLPGSGKFKNVVVIVCGGGGINLQTINELKERFCL